jgi:glycosyltransferase involved in cell wall biosynthesis
VPSAAAHEPPLRVLALAPLPFLSDGRPTFHGGGTVFYAQLVRALAARGHGIEIHAEAPPQAGSLRTPLVRDAAGLRVHPFAYEHHSSHGDLDAASLARTRARLEEIVVGALARGRPDVVLVGRDIVLPLVLETCERHDLPVLLVSHGPAVAGLVAGRYPPEVASALRRAIARADLVVAVAEHVARDLRRLGAARVVTIPNAVDTERFRPAAKDEALLRTLGVQEDAPVVLHLSLLRPWKRAHEVVDSAVSVIRARPGVVYLVVGDGPCRAEIEERVRTRGLAARFRFVGEVVHDDVPRLLALADVVVHPSEREGFPLVYREAQACGRALLASDIPPAREAIEDGRTGLLFPVGDVERLAAETLRVLADPPLRARLGAAARAAAERSGIEPWTTAYEDALRAAASRPSLTRAR